ncbi:Uncharacterised protein [Escherichia coli]|uniref:Uncharacterized protein n=1 Tax=Escherichia coli TaxID=562 RepID=A0A377AZH9_ECOLX|nr:Uncharacterised protein [Escherichia coli]
MIKKYYKGKIYPQDNPKGWVFVRILIQGDTMLYGDNYKRTAKYLAVLMVVMMYLKVTRIT